MNKMTELLNLDELISPERSVTIKGTKYLIADQTVDQMITNVRRAKEAQENTKDENVENLLADMKETCQKILPSCPADVIGGLNMRQIIALIEFAAREDQDVEDAVKAADAGSKEDAGKPA